MDVDPCWITLYDVSAAMTSRSECTTSSPSMHSSEAPRNLLRFRRRRDLQLQALRLAALLGAAEARHRHDADECGPAARRAPGFRHADAAERRVDDGAEAVILLVHAPLRPVHKIRDDDPAVVEPGGAKAPLAVRVARAPRPRARWRRTCLVAFVPDEAVRPRSRSRRGRGRDRRCWGRGRPRRAGGCRRRSSDLVAGVEGDHGRPGRSSPVLPRVARFRAGTRRLRARGSLALRARPRGLRAR